MSLIITILYLIGNWNILKMNILNQNFDSEEDDEDYVPKGKDIEEFVKVEQNDALVELRKQKQEKEVDDTQLCFLFNTKNSTIYSLKFIVYGLWCRWKMK